MRKAIIALLIFTAISACSKNDNDKEYTGVIEDYTGRLDGCAFLIQLDNGTRLEPTGNKSGQELVAGKRVAIRFRSRPAFSICMAGEMVEILRLRYL